MKERFYSERDIIITTFKSGASAINNIRDHQPDLVICGLKLLDIHGENVCREIRLIYPKVPIIVITGNQDKATEIMFYEIGIDNYIVTPIDLDLTVAKIKGSLAKSDDHGVNQNERILKAGDLTMNLDTMEITRGTLKIELTALEFDLLRLFLVNKNMILSRDKILNTVWGYDNLNGTRLVDVHVSNLRKKIDGGFKNKLIQSLRGFGYKLVAV